MFFGLGITHAFMLTENSFSRFKPAKAYIVINYHSLSTLQNSKKCSKKLRKTNDIQKCKTGLQECIVIIGYLTYLGSLISM